MNIVAFLVFFALLMVAMIVHEFAHGWTAYKLGDSTAKFSGRLTLNPFAHIDIVWTVLIPLVVFITTGFFIAAAKPVPINYWALRNPKRDIALIGVSGPASNLLFAILSALILKFVPMPEFVILILGKLIYINVMLAVFNLVPIPPLDGSRVVIGLLPHDLAQKYAAIEPYGLMIVAVLFFTGTISNVIWPAISFIMNLLGVVF